MSASQILKVLTTGYYRQVLLATDMARGMEKTTRKRPYIYFAKYVVVWIDWFVFVLNVFSRDGY